MTTRSISKVPGAQALIAAAVSVAMCSGAFAGKPKHLEGRDTVENKLQEKYQLSTFTPGRGPIKTGTFVLVQKTGLEMVAAATGLNETPGPSLSYQDGRLSKMGGSKFAAMKNMALKDRLMPIDKGTALIVTKIEAKEDHVAFDVVTADAIEGTYYKAQIRFEFGHGYLESPDMSRIQSAIEGLFQIEKQDQAGGGQQGGGQQQGGAPPPQAAPMPRQAPVQQAPPPPAAPPDPPAPPAPPPAAVELKMGMTLDQVHAAKGMETKTTKFGAKQILVYPDVKITLVNGKVTSVE